MDAIERSAGPVHVGFDLFVLPLVRIDRPFFHAIGVIHELGADGGLPGLLHEVGIEGEP